MKLGLKICTLFGAAFLCSSCTSESAQPTSSQGDDLQIFEGTSWEGVTKFTCRPELKSSCGFDQCYSVPASSEVFIDIDLTAPSYRRCNSAGCTTMTPTIGWDGRTANLAMLDDGYFFRVDGRGLFMDSAPLMISTVLHFGQCTRN